MVCGMFSSEGVGPLVRIIGTENANIISGAGRFDTPILSEVDLGVGVECRKSGVKSVASRGVGSPVLSSDTSTLSEK